MSDTTYSVQTILNRVFDESGLSLNTQNTFSPTKTDTELQSQTILNKVFDSTNNLLRVS